MRRKNIVLQQVPKLRASKIMHFTVLLSQSYCFQLMSNMFLNQLWRILTVSLHKYC